jgi:hypothetical protein
VCSDVRRWRRRRKRKKKKKKGDAELSRRLNYRNGNLFIWNL